MGKAQLATLTAEHNRRHSNEVSIVQIIKCLVQIIADNIVVSSLLEADRKRKCVVPCYRTEIDV